MEFRFTTEYDREALTTLARTLRKTARRKRSRRSRVVCAVIIALSVLLTVPLDGGAFTLDGSVIVTWITVAILLAVLLLEDRLNGYIAGKRMVPGLRSSAVIFREDGYSSETEVGTSEFTYRTITALAETENYFVFVFGKNHAQVYDKRGMEGGTAGEFRAFLEKVTGMRVEKVGK